MKCSRNAFYNYYFKIYLQMYLIFLVLDISLLYIKIVVY